MEDKIIKKGEEIIISKRKKELTPKQKAIINNKDQLKTHNNMLGGFILMCYIKNELLFNHLNLDRANISRLIYLSTYIDYNDRQENLLVKYGRDKKVEPMTREDIFEKMNLKQTAFKSFLSQMKSSNLIYEVNKKFYLSNEYFSKGNVNIGNKNKEYTRIYIDTTRFLYENTSPRKHKQLSYIFQLIPKLNYYNNILCNNTQEKEVLRLDRIGITDICNYLEISNSIRNANKIKQELLNFYLIFNNKKYYFFRYFTYRQGDMQGDFFVVNPLVIWKGCDFGNVKNIINECYFF